MGRGAVNGAGSFQLSAVSFQLSAVSFQLFEQTKPILQKCCVLSGLWRIFRPPIHADGFQVFEPPGGWKLAFVSSFC
jgi:hypothetical protein